MLKYRRISIVFINMKPNILFLSLDALRFDRCFGKAKTSKTPGIDLLIKNGTLFEQAISCSDSTPSSFASTFTGLYPFISSIAKGHDYKMNSEVENYISILRNNGYDAHILLPGLFHSSQFIKLFNNEGDSTYHYFDSRLYNGLGKRIIEKINSKTMKEPWIFFIHLMDTHKPINFPDEFMDDSYGKDDYDKLISSVDVWISKILNEIDFDRTIVVLTSDHGDYLRVIERDEKRISFEYRTLASSFLTVSKILPRFLYSFKIKASLTLAKMLTELKLKRMKIKLSNYERRNLFGFRSKQERLLYDELFRVPLILAGSGIPKNMIIKNQVRNVDIFPTLLDLIGIKFKNKVHGESLVPMLKGEKLDEKPAYLESGLWLPEDEWEKAAIGIRTSEFKYFRSPNNLSKKKHLYSLLDDPHEEVNIIKKSTSVMEKMEKILSEIRDKKSEFEFSDKSNDDEREKVEEQLRKLGYI